MWILYSLLGLLALVSMVLSIPVYGRLTYDGTFSVRIRVLGIPIVLMPRPEPEKKASSGKSASATKKSQEKKPSKLKELAELLKQDDLAGTLHFIGEVAALAGKTVGRLLRSITVNQLDLQMRIATDDVATTAQRYGQVCGVLYPALALIERWVRIRRRNLRVEPNFLVDNSAVRFDIRLQVSLWRLLGAAVALLWGFLMIKEQSNPQNQKEVS